MQLVRAKKRVQPLFGVLDARHFPNHHPGQAIPRDGKQVVVQIAAGQRGMEIGPLLERLKQVLPGKRIPACRPCEANEPRRWPGCGGHQNS